MNSESKQINDLYNHGFKSMKRAESMPRGETRQELYLEARRTFEQVMELTESLSLFSDNESVDDVATGDLKYLLIPAYLSKIAISSECSPNRIDTFTRADLLARKFLETISKYGLGNKSIASALRTDSDLCAKSSSTTILESAVRSRNEKIEQYKRMKHLDDRIVELEKKLNHGGEIDDDVAREYYLKLLDRWIIESLDSLEKEIKPALFFETNRQNQHRDITGELEESISLQGGGSSKNPPKTFTIVKDNLQKQVFGLGYPSRPTVTVDEFIQKKIDDGDLVFDKHKEVYGNSLQRYAEKPNLRREQEDLSDAEHDDREDKDDEEELKKKRNWDEFKDENPRGSGNRHNMG